MDFLWHGLIALISASLTISTPVIAQEPARIAPQNQSQIQLSYAPIVKQSAPAVVNIYTSRTVKVRSPFMNDPFFGQFFGRQFGGVLGEKTVNSLGSGVIISADGLIVTSNHVIKDAQEVSVVLSDRRKFKGKIILNDPKTDLALLRIEGKNLPFLRMHDSDRLEVVTLCLP